MSPGATACGRSRPQAGDSPLPPVAVFPVATQRAEPVAVWFRAMLESAFAHLPPDARAMHAASWTPEALARQIAAADRPLLEAGPAPDSPDSAAPAGILFGSRPEGGIGTLVWLAVDPQHRGRGIGGALVDGFATWCRAAGCHKLRVFMTEQPLVGFYRRHGFHCAAFHDAHWWGLDHWEMVRHFPDTAVTSAGAESFR